MNYGRVNHGDNAEFDRMAWYITHKMNKAPRHKWKDTFDIMSEGLDDKQAMKNAVWARMQQ